MKRLNLLLIVYAASAALSACSGKTEKEGQATAKPRLAVELQTVATSTLLEGIEVTGSLEPKFRADVKTQIPGLVREVYVNEWVRVHKGQKLARIDLAETEALVKRAEASLEMSNAGMAQAQVAVTRAERELARIQKLKEAGLATQQSLDDTKSESDAAGARTVSAKAQIRASEEELHQLRARLLKGTVLAPLDGVIALRSVNVGDLASDAATASPIFRIVDNRLLNLTVTVPSSAAARVKVGQPLEFDVDSLPGKIFKGTVMYVNPELSTADRSLKVIAEVRNPTDELKSGLFAKGRIVTGCRRDIVQIPRNWLTSWDNSAGKGKIYVLEGDMVHDRQVATGVLNGDQVEVLSGLKPGERVVSRGGFNLKDGDKVFVPGAPKQP